MSNLYDYGEPQRRLLARGAPRSQPASSTSTNRITVRPAVLLPNTTQRIRKRGQDDDPDYGPVKVARGSNQLIVGGEVWDRRNEKDDGDEVMIEDEDEDEVEEVEETIDHRRKSRQLNAEVIRVEDIDTLYSPPTTDASWVYPMIESVSRHPCIWDRSHRGPKFNLNRKKAWDEIADEVAQACGGVKVPQDKLKTRWRTIRDGHQRYLKKPGDGTFMYAQALEFLNPSSLKKIFVESDAAAESIAAPQLDGMDNEFEVDESASYQHDHSTLFTRNSRTSVGQARQRKLRSDGIGDARHRSGDFYDHGSMPIEQQEIPPLREKPKAVRTPPAAEEAAAEPKMDHKLLKVIESIMEKQMASPSVTEAYGNLVSATLRNLPKSSAEYKEAVSGLLEWIQKYSCATGGDD